jgi:hypothetical protein
MVVRLNKQADVFAINSIPLELCKWLGIKEIKWIKKREKIRLNKNRPCEF